MGFLALALGGNVSATEDGVSFFADVRKAYSERASYSDVGQIEITEEIDGIEESRVHFFETATTRDAGMVWRALMESDRGFEERVVWLAGDSVMVYDGGLWQAKPVRSIAKGIEDILGAKVGQALVVPSLLELGVGSEALDALAMSASLGEPEPCFDDRECRLVSAPLPEGGEIRLRVETGTFWIHDVEVIAHDPAPTSDAARTAPGAATGPKTTTVRVSHSEAAFEDTEIENRAAFSPPTATREVTEWEPGETAAPEAVDPQRGFYDVITIDVFTVVARIVTDSGHPLLDLEPSDLIATIGGQELPVTALDWYGVTREPDAEPVPGEREIEPLPMPAKPRDQPGAEGRLVVIFLQNDFEPTRVKGMMKLFPGLRELVDGLDPADRVAVLSYFGHLKLWQDFTTDRAAVKASLERAFYPGAKPDAAIPSPGVSLLDYFDEEGARDVASSVEALHFTSDALAPIPGEKDVVFFGYGLEGGDVRPMLRALQAARATTFVIDTTQADFHTLGGGLMTMAQATGGTYESSYNFADQALHKIERTVTGHYVITIDRSEMPDVRGALRIRLRDKKGTVLMAPSELR